MKNILLYFMLFPTFIYAQIWDSGGSILSALSFYEVDSSLCFPDINSLINPNAGIEDLHIECNSNHYLFRPQSSNAPFCIALYDERGQVINSYEADVIKLTFEQITYVVVRSSNGEISAGRFIPYPDIKVDNDCERIRFSSSPYFYINVNGIDVGASRYDILIEDITDFDEIIPLSFEVQIVENSTYNNLNCAVRPSLTYTYLPPTIDLSVKDTVLCEGENLQIHSPFHPSYTYEWNIEGTEASAFINDIQQDTDILLVVRDSIGCAVASNVLVETSSVYFELGADMVVPKNEELTICIPHHNLDYSSYLWSNGDIGYCTTMQVTENTILGVTATNAYGCSHCDSIQIAVIALPIKEKEKEISHILNCNDLYIPNVIATDSAQHDNRAFRVFSSKPLQQIAMAKIFDRWGNLLSERQALAQDRPIWDAKQQNGNYYPSGVYAYWLLIEVAHDEWITCKGDLTLIKN